MTTVHVVLPDIVDDPDRPSGGSLYDLRLCQGLARLGWPVREHRVPAPLRPAADVPPSALSAALARADAGDVVLLDGLVASAAPDVLVPEATRLRLVVLVHLPLGAHDPRTGDPLGTCSPGEGDEDLHAREGRALRAVAAVVVVSRWTREWLLAAYGLAPDRVAVVPPGVDPAGIVPGSATGSRLTCVGAVTPTKGQDVLVEALAAVADLAWSATVVGSTALDAQFAHRVQDRASTAGLRGRVHFAGPRVGDRLDAVYAAADLVLAPSRTETYGMVVTEALARGIPVVGAEVGGLPEALGRARTGSPGILVPPGDPAPLAAALRRWLTDGRLRDDLRRAALQRREALDGWDVTARRFSGLLRAVAA